MLSQSPPTQHIGSAHKKKDGGVTLQISEQFSAVVRNDFGLTDYDSELEPILLKLRNSRGLKTFLGVT